jgi:2-polyprenyl-6-methoxyphenol hydroxylase-like FAD-dependent oxidoreductase
MRGPYKPRILSKEEKQALLASRWVAHLEATQKTAVVVGGGPGGLAAAITLAQMGMKVTVLEARANETGDKPAHARPHQISLRQDSLETLKTLGAYDDVIASAGFVDKEVHIQRNGAQEQIHERVPQGQSQDHNEPKLLRPTLLHSDSVSQVRISDVEKALLKQAEELGIEIKAGVKAELTKPASGNSYGVSIRDVEKDSDGGYVPVGEATDLGTPDLVVVADGAGSPTRAALGINVLEESAPKNYLGGHIQMGIGSETRKATVTEPTGLKRHIMATGHAKYDQTWVSVEITPEEAKLPAAERAKLLADKAAWVMLEDVKTSDIGWGAGQLTTVQNRRAEKVTAGDNVVLLGDSAGTGSVWVGGGLNLALTTHLSVLRSLATRINMGDDRQGALKIYDHAVQWATSVWHQAGAAELGVKDLPSAEAKKSA